VDGFEKNYHEARQMRSRSSELIKTHEKSMDLGPVTGPGDLGRVLKDVVRYLKGNRCLSMSSLKAINLGGK
jgi:hypothetical protein